MNRGGLFRSHFGDQGELWFAAQLPRGWIWQPPRRDVGKDGLIVIHDGSELHNLEFSVQIKTAERPKIGNGSVTLSGVSRASIRYWFASPLPTLVVVVDLSNSKGWYAWHLDLFTSPSEFLEAKSETLTIRIPAENQLGDAGWSAIRIALLRHFRALQRALSTDAIAPRVMVAVNNAARITANLMRLGSGAPPEPPLTKDEGVKLLFEQTELRALIDTVRSVLGRLAEGSEAHKQIAFWLTSFEDMATAGHPSVLALPPGGEAIPLDFELAFVPQRLLELRPRLVVAAVDFIRLLTSPHPCGDSTT
jgi:Domain of unknown function (DUF4365)